MTLIIFLISCLSIYKCRDACVGKNALDFICISVPGARGELLLVLGQVGQHWGQDLLTASMFLVSFKLWNPQSGKKFVWVSINFTTVVRLRTDYSAWSCTRWDWALYGWVSWRLCPFQASCGLQKGSLLYFTQSSPSISAIWKERD